MTLTEAINLAKAGKSAEWSTIIIAVYKEKYFITSKYINQDADIKSILNDAYVKALSNIKYLYSPKDFSKWLGIVIANTAANHIKNSTNQHFSEEKQTFTPDFYKSFPKKDGSFNENTLALSNDDIKNISAQMLSALSPAQKISLLLYCFEDLSAGEIAKALQCTEKAAVSFLNNGTAALKAKTEELQKQNSKLSAISNPVSFLTYLLNSEFDEFDYNIADEAINKIIEGAAAIVAERNYNEAEQTVDAENSEEEKSTNPNKKIIIVIAIIAVFIICAVVFAFVNAGRKPSAPANNSNSISDSLSSDTSEESTSEESTSESSTESTSESSTASTAVQNTPQGNNTPTAQQNYNQRPTAAPNNTSPAAPNTTPPATASTTIPATAPTTAPSTAPPATEPPTDPPVEPDPEPEEPDPNPEPEEPVME